jgi:cellulose biosynthesis protein BcsQ
MTSIAFFNNKGGVGKTTLVCNISAYLSLHLDKKVCVVDADPQCNATQYFFDSAFVERLYSQKEGSKLDTVYTIIEPLSRGEGYSEKPKVRHSKNFGVDVVLGDPRLALAEDLLATDWGTAKSGDVRGIRTSLVFHNLLKQLKDYDYVLFDVSPSLGAINRSILLSSDYFLSPMSIDIFSLRAFENISKWLQAWQKSWARGIEIARENQSELGDLPTGKPNFLGYVTQQYVAKKDAGGKRRAVNAYEEIRKQIDTTIADQFPDDDGIQEIGTVPNLFSLIPMSQSNNKPVFELISSDGVVGAHFTKVKESKSIFGEVASKIVTLTK